MNKKNNLISFLSLLISVFFVGNLAAEEDLSSPVGKWRTIDDETGKAKSIIELSLNNDELEGRVVELINPSKPDPVCGKCKGERKDKPITGMLIVWGVTENESGGKWGGGYILDPKKGKQYKVKLSLKDKGRSLKVRGYIGAPMLGRTQIWQRVEE